MTNRFLLKEHLKDVQKMSLERETEIQEGKINKEIGKYGHKYGRLNTCIHIFSLPKLH